EGDGLAGDLLDRFHLYSSGTQRSAGVARRPVTAVAAATAGDTRWVRPPAPWRPSKLRLDVEAQRSPGESVSGFIPRHIEHPALRHSAPDSAKTRSSPDRKSTRLNSSLVKI